MLNKADITENLKNTVYFLSKEIGPRPYSNLNALNKTSDYISASLKSYGYDVSYQPYKYKGNNYKNIYTEIKGNKTPEISIVIGAHYDTVSTTPGADDNSSGVAGLLEIARLLENSTFDKTIRFVAFTLEEPPAFMTKNMGSYVYAKSLKENNENVELMICLEMIGYFSKKQKYPLPVLKWFYPHEGDFILLAGDTNSQHSISKVKNGFRKGTVMPVESITAPRFIPGIDFSDHRSFWKFGYNAIMVTDTAFYRNPNYHRSTDTPETLDYDSITEVVLGLKSAICEIANIKM
ncbi:MAG: M28 family peptidase [Nitrospirae bacterium]|nr:M28 family peptidase [Nitrospirota bacterium]MBF0535761.1 M28 family peptidase [Nitrospirota bacterium]MBF0615790.1 M28 family peptidase [Nitrospirota bacterium]